MAMFTMGVLVALALPQAPDARPQAPTARNVFRVNSQPIRRTAIQ